MKREYQYITKVTDQLPEIPPDSILSRTFFQDEQLRVILFGFAPGQELSEHTASKPAILHFLTGEAKLTLGEDEMEALPGTWVHMPAHLPHSILAKSSVVMLLTLLEGTKS